MKARKLFILFSLSILSIASTLAQPVWVPTTPSLGTIGPLTIPINYGIDRVGTVYIVIHNFNNPTIYTSATIKAAASAPLGGQLVYNAVIPVTAGNINIVLQVIADVINTSTDHTIYIVAEDGGGVLQAAPTVLHCTTLPCPDITLFTFFGNTGDCVNLGATGMFQAAPLGILPTGVLKGTTWTVDWGDGTAVWSYTSTANDDIPGIQLHTYANLTSCNYVGTWTVQNPCGKFANASNVFVVHGRDIPLDGDGVLRMEETTTHAADIVYVCEGKQHNIKLADISTWNCQNPVVPFPLIAKPNNSLRTIQFIYGQSPTGVVGANNTITGNVLIAGVNICNAVSGWDGPLIKNIPPPNPNTQSDVITIPATCAVGQRFFVYLKDWNKCNPYTGNPAAAYVFNSFIIEIIASPPAPIVTTPLNYCFGSVPLTISATPNLPGNTINWYADAGLTTLLFTGQVYTHSKTAVGTYNYWVTETSGTNGCEGPAAPITMIINPVINNNTVAAVQTICYNSAPVGLTGSAPGGGTGAYTYQWQNSADNVTFNNILGGTTINYAPPALTATTYYRRIVTSGPCTDFSSSLQITVNPLPQGSLTVNGPFCATGAGLLKWTATAGTGPYTVVYTENGGANRTAAGVVSGTSFATFTTPVITTTTYALVSVTDANGCVRNAGFTGGSAVITVNALPQGSLTANGPFCATGAGLLTWTATAGTGPYTVVYTENGGANRTAAGVVSGTSFATFTTPVITTTTYALVSVTDANGCVRNAGFTGGSAVITVRPLPQGSLTANGPFCATGAGLLTWTSTAGTGPFTVVYTENGGANRTAAGVVSGTSFATFTTPVIVTTTYALVSVTDANGCVRNAGFTGGSAVITVNALPQGSLTNNGPFCVTGAGLLTWTASAGAGPYTVVYTENGGANRTAAGVVSGTSFATFTTPVIVTTTYALVSVTDANGCVRNAGFTGGSTVITVNTLPQGSLTANGPFCATGAGLLTWTASAGTGPYTVVYTENGGANRTAAGVVSGTSFATFTTPVIVTTTYALVSVTDANGCTRNAGFTGGSAVITVNPNLPVSVTAAASANPVCTGTSVTFTATPTNGGAAPAYQWYKGAAPVGANSPTYTYTPLNGDLISVVLTSNITPCATGNPATSNVITMTVNPLLAVSVTIAASANPVCTGTSVTFTATPVNGGTTPTYQWYNGAVPVGASSPTYTYTPSNGDIITVVMTSTACTVGGPATSNAITMTVNTLPQGSLTANGPFCATGAGLLTWTASSGTGPYTVVYTENGGANRTAAGVVSGTSFATFTTPVITTTTYALVSVTDANGCIRSAGFTGGSAVITVRPLPQGSLTANGPFCATGAGLLTWTSTAGTGPFTVVYTENGGANRTAAGVVSGTSFATFTTPVITTTTYALVSVTDANGCVRNAGFTGGSAAITVNALPQGSLTANGPFCATGAGLLTWTSTAGTGPFTVVYTENGGANRTAAGVVSGTSFATFTTPVIVTTTYALVSVTDANGCVRNAGFTGGSAAITVNALPQGSLTANGPFCATGAGLLTWTSTAGTGPYTVVYTENGGANRTAAGVVSGTSFATFTTPVIVTTTYALVSVTDANGCVRNAGFTGGSAVITVRPLPQGSLTANGPFCATGAGLLTWTSTAGTGPYTVVYTENGGANRTAAGVVSGTSFATFTTPVIVTTTYALVSVTDANGCVRNAGFTGGSAAITVNALPQGSLTANGPFCATGAGLLTWTSTAGTGPYTVVYTENGGANRTAAGVVSGTSFATFTTPVIVTTTYALVSVTDANGCVRNAGFTGGSAVITVRPLPQGSLTANGPFCATGAGLLTWTASAGTGPFTVVYTENGGANRTAAGVVSGTSFATFTTPVITTTTYALVSVTDANGCVRNAGFTGGSAAITVNALPQGSLTANGPFCATGAGLLTWTSTAGTGPYTVVYTENGGANRTAAGVVSGTSFATFTTPVIVTTTYALVSVTDANGCVRNAGFTGGSATITVNTLPQGSLTANGPFCATGAGLLTWTATAGTGPYTVVYTENGGANRTAAGVVSGTSFATFTTPVITTTTYALVSVTDANGCVRNAGFTGGSAVITVRPLPQGSLTANGPFCATGAGLLTWTSTAGTGPYTVVYTENGGANRTAAGVVSGTSFATFTTPVITTTTYALVSVTDANGCVRNAGFTGGSAAITVNALPQGSLTANGPFCATGAGLLTWTSSAGTGPYTVVYTENGGANRTAAGVVSGTSFATFTTPVITTTTYALVSVTDANGCVRNAGFTGGSAAITVNTLPQGSLTANGPFCATGAGLLTWTATAGTGPYTVVYTENGGANRTAAGVVSGTSFATFTTPVITTTTYALVSVTDANGCVRNAGFTGGSAIITVRPLPQGSLTANGPFCASGAGLLTWTSTAGTGPFTVVYTENGGANRTAAGVVSGTSFATFTTPVITTTTYALVSVTDANGCVRSAGFTGGSAVITVNASLQGSLTANGPFCATGAGLLTWTASAGAGPYTVVYTENGGANRTAAGVISGTSFATFTTPVITTTTYALVSVTDANGCTRNAGFTVGSAVITVNALPQGSLTANGPFCATGAGLLTWTASSGTGPYTVVYTENGGANRTAAGVVSGTSFATFTTPVTVTTTYALVSVTDANGCVRNAGFTGGSAAITVNTLPQGSLTANGPFCATGAGLLTWTASAGTGPYTVVYTENGGANRTAAGVVSGTAFATFTTPVIVTTNYALVSVTDANGCVRNAGFTWSTATITINPLPVTAPIVGDTVICQDAMNEVYQVKTPPARNINTTYTWSVPAVMTVTSPAGLYFIIADATGPSLPTDKISVYETYNATGCKGAAVDFPIIISPSKIGENVKGTTPVCRNASGVKFWVTLTAGSTYTWSLPPGAFITSNPDSAAVFVTFPITTAGNVSVVEKHGACTTYDNPLYVTVNALPTPILTGEAAPCISSSHVYTTDAGMSNYIWTISAGGTKTAGGTPTDNTVTITWNTGGAQSVTVNYNNANGCTAETPKTESISVYPLPVPTLTGNAAACLNSTGNVYKTETGMTNYLWSVSAGGSITSGGGTTDNSVTIRWDNTGVQTVTVNYTNSNGCTAVTPASESVTVNPLPTPTISGPTPVCAGSTGNTYQTELSKLNYIWTIPAGGIITAGGTGYDHVTVNWTTTGTKTVTVNYTDINGCTAATATSYSVVVNALPVPTITGNAAACVGSTGNIYTTEAGMTGYTWVVTGGTVSAGGSPTDRTVTVTWNIVGPQTVSVNYTNTDGCTATAPKVYNVTVNTLPVPTIAGNSTACQNSTGNVYTTEAGMTNYTWVVTGGSVTAGGTNTDRTVTVTWTATGAQTVTINYTNSNGCTATTATVKNVIVNALPAPTLGGPAAACVNSTGNVYTTEAGMTNYLWNVTGGTITAGGTTTNTITVTWNTAGAQTVKVNYTDANGCTSAAAAVYNVNVNALPVITIAGPTPVCVNSTGNIYTTQAGMTNYLWTVSAGGTVTAGGGTGDNTVTVTWTTIGAQTVSVNYTNGTGCTAGTAKVYNVTVNALPVPTITGNSAACLNSTGNVYTTEAGMTGYTWIVTGGNITAGGTPTDRTVTVTWITTGSESVSVNYTNGNGCTAATATIKNVTVNALPVPTLGGAASVCVNSGGHVYTTDPGMTNYLWGVTGGTITAGGSFSNTITVTWNTAGPQTVSVNYTDANGCTAAASTTYAVTVNPLPVVTSAGPTPVCVTSTGNIYTTEAGMTGYVWNISAGGSVTAGGTGTDNTATVTWNTAGAQTVSVNYVNANGCTAAIAKVYNVTVNPLPVPTITGNAAACVNSTGNIYTTQAAMTGYTWGITGGAITSGGTATDNTATVTWSTVGTGTISVNYTNGNGCTAATATVKNVIVNALPTPTIAGPASVCVNSTGNVYSTEPGMSGYLWTVPAGGTITSGGGAGNNTVTVTWNTVGPQNVSVNYNNSNGCTAAAATSYAVTVNALPAPTITGPASVCNNSTGNTYNTETLQTNYLWTVSSGGVITAGGIGYDYVTVTWTSTGAKTVTVNYTNAANCTAASPTVYNVTVNALPVPSLSGIGVVCETSAGNIYSTEAGMTSYIWIVSAGGAVTAGGTATDNSVTVKWNTPGAQSVSVNYTNGNGCTATTAKVKPVTVNALPVPTISGNAAACLNSTGNVYSTEPGMTNYIWSITGGSITSGGTLTDNTVTITWNTVGAETVSVNYTNASSCTATAPVIKTVTVNALPVVTIAGPASVCKNSTGNIYTTEAGMSNYLWVVSAGGTVTSGGTTGNNTTVITWTTTGPQSVSVNYTNANGCTAAASTPYAVTVNPLPVPALTGPLSPCVTSTGNLYTTDAAMTNYIWTVSSGGTITAGGTATDNSMTITWNTSGSQSVSVNYTNGNGCTAATAKIAAITVNPLPVPTISGNTAACVSSTGNVYTTQGGMTSYIWSITGGTITSGGTAIDNTATVTWSAVGTGTISVNYTNGNGCTAATPTINNVTVNALPVVTLAGPASVCQNSTGNTYTTESGMTNYTWAVSAGGNITAGGSPVNNTIVVTWNTTGPQTVSVNYNNANGCTAAAATVYNVTVNALPVPTIAGPTPVCAASTGNVYTTQAGMTSYVWTVPAGGIITSGGTATDNTVTVTWNGAGVRTVKVNYTNLSGCTAALPGTYNVTVNPLPVAILSGGETICSGQSSILNVTMLTGTGPYTVNIQNIAAPILNYNSGANITVTPLATTTYTLVSVTDANGCIQTTPANLMGSATVTVRTPASITTQPVDKTVCEYGVTFFSTVAAGTDITYQWYESQGGSFAPITDGGIYFGANTNKLNLYGTTRLMDGWKYHVVINNCSADVTSADVTLTVNTNPEITSEPSDTTICSTQGTVFKATATGTALTYQWQVNTGSGFGNIDVNPSYTGHISGATSNTLTITNALPAYNDDLFMIKVSGTCGSPVFSTIVSLRVNTPPTVTLNPAVQAVCDGAGTVYFRGRGTGMIDSLRWQVNTGSGWNDIYDDAIYSSTMSQQLTVMNPPVSYNGYQYRLALKAYCQYVYTAAATLTVHTNPVVNFVPASIPACGGVAQTLTPVITSGSGTWSQHIWTGDIGPLNNPNIQTPVFRTLLAGTYNLNYKVKDNNGCYGNGDLAVVVDAPDATFTQDATNGCTPQPVQFTKNMTGYTSFTWDYGDGSPVNTTVASPLHAFTNATPAAIKYYTVSLTVNTAGGCSSTKTSIVTVYPAISATFTSDKATVCSGGAITYTALSGAANYAWDFGDVTGDPAGSYVESHIYTNPGATPLVLTVKLITTSFYSCMDTKTLTVTIMPIPAASFTAGITPQVWQVGGNPITVVNTTNPGTWLYLWDFGDATTSTLQNPPVHTYTATGTFPIKLTVTNTDGSCPNSVTHPIKVTPLPPIASFDSIPNGCEPQFVTFKNTTQNQIPGTTYLWDFGDNNYSTTKNPTYTYQAAGDYKIVLTVTGPFGQVDSCFQVVHIYQSPKAYFEVTPQLVFVNDENVRCFNLTTNGDTYKWDFGDGETSTEKEPFHKYMAEGVYDITLWARSANDCYNKYTLSPAVTVQPAGVLRFASVFTPNQTGPEEPTIDQISADQLDKFFFPPIREKVINYKLQIFNRLGVLIFQSDDIQRPWNGYYKGKMCPQGVYVWYVEGKYATGKVFKKVGDITLLH